MQATISLDRPVELTHRSRQIKGSILMVGNFLSASLTTRFVCEDLALRLSQSNWNVLTTSTKVNRFSRLLDMTSAVFRRRHEYSVAQVDVYSGAAFVWAEVVCGLLKALNKPYILTLHGGNLPVFAKRWPGRVKRLLGSGAVVTTPSRYLLEGMRPYRSDLELLPNPLDTSRYTFRLRTQASPSLVWLRAFHSIYNPTLVPRVLAELATAFPEIKAVMVGPDKGDGSLQATQQLAQQNGTAGRLSFPGGVPKADVPNWLQKGDIFLNTTNVDNTPISVLEAMASGLVVVSTNVGGIPHLLHHQEDALLVPPDDAKAMAQAVRNVLTEPGLAERLSSQGRQATESFDWGIILPRWENLFHKLTGSIR